jgi:hypothetical protein
MLYLFETLRYIGGRVDLEMNLKRIIYGIIKGIYKVNNKLVYKEIY